MKKIWYHGTSKKNARSILKSGFKKETWFAKDLQDAIAYGGFYVFEVVLKVNRDSQICCKNKIKTKHIVSLRYYYIQSLFEDEELRETLE
jgi:hypothetical protein